MTTEPEPVEPADTLAFATVEPPDGSARAAALSLGATKGLGRLGELGAWIASCQGHCPPSTVRTPRVVVFAADHGIALRNVSAHAAGTTAELVADLLEGRSTAGLFAGITDAGVRVVDVGLTGKSQLDRTFRVRDSSGAIDVEDALTPDEALAAVRAGAAVADTEVDSGADLLIAGILGVAATTPASTLVAALTGTEPVAVIGRGSGIDDSAWMRKATAVRDALRRARPVLAEPTALLRTVGGADIAAMAGFLAQAALRRTPVVLDGLEAAAAALVAEELAPGAREWWLAAQLTPEPAFPLVLEHLDLKTVHDVAMSAPGCAAGIAALPLLVMATRALAEG